MPIFKAPNNDTAIYDSAPDGWVEITDQELDEIRASRLAGVVATAPTSLTMAQARIALLDAGLLDTVEAGIAQMPRAAQIKWEFAATVERSDSLTQALAAALGLTELQLDDLFTAGAAL